MFFFDSKEKLEELLEDILLPYPDLFCASIGIHGKKYDFRISNRKLKTFTNWSRHLIKREIKPEPVRAEVMRLIEEAGWDVEMVIPKEWMGGVSPEPLIQSIRVLCSATHLEGIHVVTIHPQEGTRFIEVDDPHFTDRMNDIIREPSNFPIGLIGWEVKDDSIQARKLLLPWYSDWPITFPHFLANKFPHFRF
jgi:hypothetical protein